MGLTWSWQQGDYFQTNLVGVVLLHAIQDWHRESHLTGLSEFSLTDTSRNAQMQRTQFRIKEAELARELLFSTLGLIRNTNTNQYFSNF